MDPSLVARAVHVEICRKRVYRPLWIVDARRFAVASDGAIAAVRGSVVCLLRADDADLGQLGDRDRRLECSWLVDSPGGPEFGVDEAHHRCLRVAAHHRIATDPTLARAREALARVVSTTGPVCLVGSPGSDRAALARWAHAAYGEAELAVFPEVGRGWSLVPDVDELAREQLGPVLRRLRDEPRPVLPPLGAPTRPVRPELDEIVGRSPGLCAALAEAEAAALGTSQVLILGETGTGKDPLARAIHAMSRRPGPLVALDLASRSDELVGDDLFGHVRGAFNGADASREGAFRTAHRGTLFLDEIGNLSVPLQGMLLRVLESSEVQPLGSDRVHRVDVRVVAATNADLDEMVRDGTFRADLLHRLRAFEIRLPPLRARGDDLDLLIEACLRQQGVTEPTTASVLRRLRAYDWPGNIRELQRVLQACTSHGHLDEARVAARLPSRRGPLMMTARALADSELRPSERSLAEAVTIHVPDLATRGRCAVRHAVSSAAGTVPAADALARLESASWWSVPQLLRVVEAACAGKVEPTPVAELELLLPATGPGEPLRVAWSASVVDGALRGLFSEHATSAVVLGRARRMCEVGSDERRRWVARLVPDGAPAFVDLSHLPELSRVHAILVRTAEGLAAAVAPDVALPVVAHTLQGGTVLLDGRLTPVGRCVRLTSDEPEGGRILDLLVGLGPSSLEAAAPVLLEPALPPQSTRRVIGTGRRVWQLEPDEIRILNVLVVTGLDREEDLGACLRDHARRPPLAGTRLGRWLDTAHPGQYCARLYAHPSNERLLADLRDHLRGRATARLPSQLRRLLAGVAPLRDVEEAS